MQRIGRKAIALLLCLTIFAPMSVASADVQGVVGDILKLTTAQALFAKLAPMLGLGPPKTKEQKEQEKQEKEEKKAEKETKKELKEIKKAEKAAKKEAKPEDWPVMKMAMNGSPQAQCIVSYAYLTGQEMPKSKVEALIWQNIAAQQNAQLVKNFLPPEYGQKKLKLAQLYGIAGRRAHAGQYVKQDFKEAVAWSNMGAAEKDTMAIAYLASAYYTGRGVAQDYKAAISYANQAKKDPLALQVLADAYRYGNGVKQDQEKSAHYERYRQLVIDKQNAEAKERALKRNANKIKAGKLNGIVR
ncbi:MAG: sel1 repeat family protein [Selenomonadaceae bacterium]|nr:sel1 repeat family protein [Selenomonadaceae bacterium]